MNGIFGIFDNWKDAHSRANYYADVHGRRQSVKGMKGVDGKWRYANTESKKVFPRKGKNK